VSERGKERGQSQVNVQPSFFLTIGARIGVLLGIIESPGIPNQTEAVRVSKNPGQSQNQSNMLLQELFWAALNCPESESINFESKLSSREFFQKNERVICFH
jgi:hypothetical protein